MLLRSSLRTGVLHLLLERLLLAETSLSSTWRASRSSGDAPRKRRRFESRREEPRRWKTGLAPLGLAEFPEAVAVDEDGGGVGSSATGDVRDRKVGRRAERRGLETEADSGRVVSGRGSGSLYGGGGAVRAPEVERVETLLVWMERWVGFESEVKLGSLLMSCGGRADLENLGDGVASPAGGVGVWPLEVEVRSGWAPIKKTVLWEGE